MNIYVDFKLQYFVMHLIRVGLGNDMAIFDSVMPT